jgi:hypothetical protein
MDFTTFASHMYPFWILGVCILGLVIAAGQKHWIRIEKSAVLRWMRFLAIITACRFAMSRLPWFHYLFDVKNASYIPWTVTFTVFWEDACHGLPLFILQKLIGKANKWTRSIHFILLCITMFEFGIGHLYQGPMAAFLLSFYIPYSIKKGEEYGFGTVMMCHMMYDLVTLLFVQYLLR